MAKPTIFAFNALLGGADGALDSIDGAPLVDKDLAIGVDINNFYPYQLDDDSAAAENSPLVVAPDANAGDKRWLLKNGVFAGLTLYGNITMPENGTIGHAAGPLITFNDSGNDLKLSNCSVSIAGSGVAPFIPATLLHLKESYPQFTFEGTSVGNTPKFICKSARTTPNNFYVIEFWGKNSAAAQALYGSVTMGGAEAAGDEEGYVGFYLKDGAGGSSTVFRVYGAGDVQLDGALFLKERAAEFANVATWGQVWVKNDAPNTLWFEDDAGNNRMLSTANYYVTDAGILHLGDATNYLQLAANGILTLHGTARINRHFRIGAASFFKKDTPPEEDVVGVYPVLRFADDAVEQAFYSDVIPFRLTAGTTIDAIIDWCYGIAPDGVGSDDGKVSWKIDFLNLATGEVVATGAATINGLSAVGTNLQTKRITTTVSTGITGSVNADVLGIRLWRDTNDANDTLVVDACFIQLHLHFIMDKLGEPTT